MFYGVLSILSNTFLSKTLNATSALALSAVFLGATFTIPASAMDPEEPRKDTPHVLPYKSLATEPLDSTLLDQHSPFVSAEFYRYVAHYQKDKNPQEPFDSTHPLYNWIAEFSKELDPYPSSLSEQGIKFAQSLLSLPRESQMIPAICSHTKKVINSDDFKKMKVPEDEWAENQAEKLILKLTDAIEKTTSSSRLVPLNEVPENLKVNIAFVPDPRVTLYNILLKEESYPANHRLSPVDESLEMKTALILADLRYQLFQKLIPQDEKDRALQVCFLERMLLPSLGLQDNGGQFDESRQKDLNMSYKRSMIGRLLMGYILNGRGTTDKHSYTAIDDKRSGQSRYSIPIQKGNGYANPQILVEHVVKAVNGEQHLPLYQKILSERLKLHYGDNCSEKLGEYCTDGKLTPNGVKALLYSLGYLEKAAQ